MRKCFWKQELFWNTVWGGGGGSPRSLWGDLQSWLPSPGAGGILGRPRGSQWTPQQRGTVVRLPRSRQEQGWRCRAHPQGSAENRGCSYSRQWRIRQNTGAMAHPEGCLPTLFLRRWMRKPFTWSCLSKRTPGSVHLSVRQSGSTWGGIGLTQLPWPCFSLSHCSEGRI